MALKLIYNASIITMDAAYPKAESMVINDLGKIESIGTESEMLNQFDSFSEENNFHGKTIVPGLNDAKVEFFVGAGVEMTANGSIKLSAKTECFLEKPQVFVDARVQLRTPIGLKGTGSVK